jgi:hypothetical protein
MEKTMSNKVVGMWVHVSEPEHWRVGQIVDDLGNGFYMARMEHANPEFPLKHYFEAISLAKYAMLASQCDWAGLTFFETKGDLTAYTEWMSNLCKREATPEQGVQQNVAKQDNTKSNVINFLDRWNEDE